MISDSLITWGSILIPFILLIVTVIDNTRKNKAQREANDLQKRFLAIEEGHEKERLDKTKKAILSHKFRRKQTLLSILEIENVGESEARNIRVEIEGKSIGKSELITDFNCSNGHISPGNKIQYTLHTLYKLKRSIRMTVYWDDDYKDNRSFEVSTL